MCLYGLTHLKKHLIIIMFRTLSEKWLRRTSVRYNILQVRNLIGNFILSLFRLYMLHVCIDIPKTFSSLVLCMKNVNKTHAL